MEVMSIKLCSLQAFIKHRAAREYGHSNKTLGGVQKNKRGCNLGALSEAILALHTSSGWGPAPALPDPYPLKEGPE